MFIVFTTVSKEEDAKAIAKGMVERRLAACAWVLPKMKSYYVWKGKLEEDEEYIIVFKTPEEVVATLIDVLKDIHPYETPEIIAVKADYVLPEYLKWAREVCGV